MIAVFAAGLLMSTAVLLAQTDASRFNGKPIFSEGNALGYFVWKTTFGAEHRFTGRITVEGGEIRSFKRIDVDTGRKLIAPGRGQRVVRGPRGRARVAPVDDRTNLRVRHAKSRSDTWLERGAST